MSCQAVPDRARERIAQPRPRGPCDLLANFGAPSSTPLAIVIALMGIANTLSLSIHERTRELGLLRAVGQSRRQLRRMVRGEALVVALFGTVGGLGLGTFLGWAMVKTIEAAEGLGAFAVPAGQLGVVVALGAIVGVVAAVRPARRAAKLDVLEALATD